MNPAPVLWSTAIFMQFLDESELLPVVVASVSFHWYPIVLQWSSVDGFPHLLDWISWLYQWHKPHTNWMGSLSASSPDVLLLLWSPECCCTHSNSEHVRCSSQWGLPSWVWWAHCQMIFYQFGLPKFFPPKFWLECWNQWFFLPCSCRSRYCLHSSFSNCQSSVSVSKDWTWSLQICNSSSWYSSFAWSLDL